MTLLRSVGEQFPSIAWSRATVLVALVLTTAFFLTLWQRRKPRLPDVPILQISNLPGQAGIAEDIATFIRNGKDVLQIGYDRYSKHGQNYLLRSVCPSFESLLDETRSSVFRTPWRLMFVVAPHFINEIAWVPDDKLDNHETHNELLQTRYTMHQSLEEDAYYLDVVGKQLTRNIGVCFPA